MPRDTLISQEDTDHLLAEYQTRKRRYAIIDEEQCIGCTKCIQACPFDSILGTNRQMHTVLIDRCIGCELCIPPCPVDCIAMVEREDWDAGISTLQKQASAQRHYVARVNRLLEAQRQQKEAHRRDKARVLRREEIKAAVQRVKQRKQAAASISVRKPTGSSRLRVTDAMKHAR